MTEQQACTLCGAGGHTAAQCNWNDRRLTFTLESLTEALGNVMCLHELGVELIAANVFRQHPEQAESAQGEREAFEMTYAAEFCRIRQVDDFTPSILVEMRTGNTYGDRAYLNGQWTGWQLRAALAQPSPAFAKPSLLKDCDVRYAANAQPSPELEQYKEILRTLVEEATCADWSGENDESVFHAAQQWCGKYHEAKRQLEAAQARVAELEKEISDQDELVGFGCVGNVLADEIAQAGRVPEGWKLVPLEPTEQILDEFDSIVDYGAEDSRDAWRRLLAVAGDRHEA